MYESYQFVSSLCCFSFRLVVLCYHIYNDEREKHSPKLKNVFVIEKYLCNSNQTLKKLM